MTARKMTRAACAVLALAAAAAGAGAQQLDQLGRELEIPAHAALMAEVAEADGVPAPFLTDGCSGGLSDAWSAVASRWPEFTESRPAFEHCCVAHDKTYHIAGGAKRAEASYVARLRADRALRACVMRTGTEEKAGLAAEYGVAEARVEQAYALLAGAMYYAVRFGGGPCSGLSWRWGYGFDGCREGIGRYFDRSAAQ